ncbi:hypothetical protein [Paracoccus marcusii]|uniref:hypothetical protein n=1 Tax=Paracoccus marcusii TaxID=59779 RepID=UPI0035A62111
MAKFTFASSIVLIAWCLVPGKLGLKLAEIMHGQTGLLACAQEVVYQMVKSVRHSAYQCHHCASSPFVLFLAMGQNNARRC